MKALCVYCGSRLGGSTPELAEAYAQAARDLGQAMAERGIALVYGGGRVGLMGVVADAVLAAGGEVTGVIPQGLMDLEVGHGGLTRLHVVKDMHERKALMSELSCGFAAMPGGFGTLEELFEMLTWSQLGFHSKPVGLLDVAGFYSGLSGFIQHMVAEGFVRQEHADLLLVEPEAGPLLRRLMAFRAAKPVGAA